MGKPRKPLEEITKDVEPSLYTEVEQALRAGDHDQHPSHQNPQPDPSTGLVMQEAVKLLLLLVDKSVDQTKEIASLRSQLTSVQQDIIDMTTSSDKLNASVATLGAAVDAVATYVKSIPVSDPTASNPDDVAAVDAAASSIATAVSTLNGLVPVVTPPPVDVPPTSDNVTPE